METIRLMMAIGAQNSWTLHQMDVKSAFLNGEINEEVYVSQPIGYEVEREEEKVYRLSKALYGLRQAPRAWYSKIHGHFLGMGFTRSENELTLYRKEEEGRGMLVLSLYVDDIVFMSGCAEMVEEFKTEMKRTFEMTDLGLLRFFLGLEVNQADGIITVSQRRYAEHVLKENGLMNSKISETPMNVNDKLQLEDGTVSVNPKLYRRLVGALLYLTHTRPDIQFAVDIVSRYLHAPTAHHLGAVKRILQYVRGTLGVGLSYRCSKEFVLHGYSDSDHGGSLDDRKSTSGWVFYLGETAVSWSSKKQEMVALSSTEAEYIAVGSVACQALWLRRLLEDMGQGQKEGTMIYCDNVSAIHLSKNPVQHGRTKHIDTRYHFIMELIVAGSVLLKHCSSREQKADILTKSLPIQQHKYLKEKLGLTEQGRVLKVEVCS